MAELIDIRDFKGVFTYCDPDDIGQEYLQSLKNMRSIYGKLEKTFAYGVKADVALSIGSKYMDNLITYNHDSLNRGTYDYIYVVALVSFGTGLVTLYQFDPSDESWTDFGSVSDISISGSYYHRSEYANPMFQDGTTLRLLPGYVASIGANECKGVWMDRIDRDFFDGNYLASTYTAEFYVYPTTIDKPTLNMIKSATCQFVTGAPFDENEVLYYKMSYIYDGVQESLLSDRTFRIDVSDTHNWLNVYFNITKADHNKRITAINLYRSKDYNGPFYLVHSIDLLRESTKVITGTGCSGKSYAYVPALASGESQEHTFVSTKTYILYVTIGGVLTAKSIVNPRSSGSGYCVMFEYNGVTVDSDCWDVAWELYEDGVTTGHSGTSGCYTGVNTILTGTATNGTITGNSLDTGKYILGVMKYVSNSYVYPITDNYGYGVHLTDTIAGASTTGAYYVMCPTDGLYLVIDLTTYIRYHIYDPGFIDGAQHPLEGEVSIKVNGHYAKVIGNRLWQGKIYLDPGGEEESHHDWVSYSELGQLDVNPVSNVIHMYDREGGEITGIQELYGNPVILKKQALFIIDTKTYPSEPAKWVLQESAHNIGNMSEYGSITAKGDIYICDISGIYRLSANNLAETDTTPTIKLRISDAINDKYEALTTIQKNDIITAFDPILEEVIFKLSTEHWAYNIIENTWREIDTARTINRFSYDEESKVLCYDSGNYKLYGTGASESVGVNLKTKRFTISNMRDEVIRSITLTYKSVTALTLTIYEESDITSGNIQYGVTYYNNGYTTLVYNGTSYATTESFTGIYATNKYTTTGTGTVQIRKAYTIPASTIVTKYRFSPRYRGKNFVIEITDLATSTTTTEIHRIELECI